MSARAFLTAESETKGRTTHAVDSKAARDRLARLAAHLPRVKEDAAGAGAVSAKLARSLACARDRGRALLLLLLLLRATGRRAVGRTSLRRRLRNLLLLGRDV